MKEKCSPQDVFDCFHCSARTQTFFQPSSAGHIIQQELGLRTIRIQGLLRKAGISEIGDIPKSKSCKLCVPYIF